MRAYSDEEIRELGSLVFREYGTEISRAEFFRQAPFSRTVIDGRFSSWEEFRTFLGLGPVRPRVSARKKYSAETIRDELRRVAGYLGEDLKLTDFERASGISRASVFQYFRSWTDARQAAGLSAHAKYRAKWTEQELFVELHTLVRQLGRFPKPRDIDRRRGLSRATLCRRLGGWEDLEFRYREWLSQQPEYVRNPPRDEWTVFWG